MKPNTTVPAVVIPRATFILSAPTIKELPPSLGEEFCMLGRSNVGKSSFINHLFADKALARVSKTPGKTICANVYSLDKSHSWVDLPGYGYARKSHEENSRISKLIREYCIERKCLRGVIWLLDIRHEGTAADREAWTWLHQLPLPVLPVLTKADKLGVSHIARQTKAFRAIFGFAGPIASFSTQSQRMRETFWRTFTEWNISIGDKR